MNIYDYMTMNGSIYANICASIGASIYARKYDSICYVSVSTIRGSMSADMYTSSYTNINAWIYAATFNTVSTIIHGCIWCHSILIAKA